MTDKLEKLVEGSCADEKISNLLSLLNIDLSSATFICFGVGNINLEALTDENKLDLLKHLTDTLQIRLAE